MKTCFAALLIVVGCASIASAEIFAPLSCEVSPDAYGDWGRASYVPHPDADVEHHYHGEFRELRNGEWGPWIYGGCNSGPWFEFPLFVSGPFAPGDGIQLRMYGGSADETGQYSYGEAVYSDIVIVP